MPFLVYSALRIGLLLVAAVLLQVLGMRGWLLWVYAALLALLASYALLGGPRERASAYLAARRARREAGRRFSDSQEEDFASEDAQVEVADSAPAAGTTDPDSGTDRP